MAQKSRINKLLLCEENRSKYDKKDTKSILKYATKLKGMTFEDILRQNGLCEEDICEIRRMSMRNKGLLGNLIELAWFGYPSNSAQQADFSDAGIELKSTPYEGEGENIRPGETLSLTQINYRVPQEKDFSKSHVWKKIRQLLLVYYLRQKAEAQKRKSKLFYSIDYVFMLKPDAKDLAIIKADYRLLVDIMIRGDAHELSRTNGVYLGVAPKSGKKEYVPQYYGEHIPALKRAFVLKMSYLKFVLHRAAGITEDTGGTIIKDASELQNETFAEILKKRVSHFIGMEINEIWRRTKRPDEEAMPKAKNEDAVVSCRMLGVSHNRVEEFVKAGILPKVIKFRKEKSKNQQFRLEDITFNDLASEEKDDWEASKLFSYLVDRQYFFMVFWETDEGLIFKGCQLWGISDTDLETVKAAWLKTKEILDVGVEFSIHCDKKGKEFITNNLPGMSDNGVFHIRPHASRSYYVIGGKKYGNGSESDSDLLPNGDRIVKQAYWLNRSYVESQLHPELVMHY